MHNLHFKLCAKDTLKRCWMTYKHTKIMDSPNISFSSACLRKINKVSYPFPCSLPFYLSDMPSSVMNLAGQTKNTPNEAIDHKQPLRDTNLGRNRQRGEQYRAQQENNSCRVNPLKVHYSLHKFTQYSHSQDDNKGKHWVESVLRNSTPYCLYTLFPVFMLS